MAESSADSKTSKLDPIIARGSKIPSPYTRATFIGLRAIDPLFQYSILSQATGANLLKGVSLPPHLYTAPTLTIFNTETNLTPHGLILILMSVGSSLKQIYWVSSVSEEEVLVRGALLVPFLNTVLNGINNLLSTTEALSLVHSYDPHLSVFEQVGQLLGVPRVALGVSAFVVGIALETVSEVQRRNFKKKPENKGKVYEGGLFKYARHINFAGYTLWRSGFALTGGGWIWGAIVFGFLNVDFSSRAIPALDEYCKNRYGVQWLGYKRNVPHKMWPKIY